MLYWTIQITIVSIILIFLVHHLINFFKSTLTVPKIKDLVNTPTQKYENMYNIILQNNNKNDKNDSHVVDYTEIDLLPKPNVENMKNELKSFLKEQLKAENSNKDFTKFDELREYQTYSEY
jgi:hypothetical protein